MQIQEFYFESLNQTVDFTLTFPTSSCLWNGMMECISVEDCKKLISQVHLKYVMHSTVLWGST